MMELGRARARRAVPDAHLGRARRRARRRACRRGSRRRSPRSSRGELRAATFVREGGDDEPCDYIYVLCMGRAPCIVQVRDHGVPPPAEWASVDRDRRALPARGDQPARAASRRCSRSRSSCSASDGGWLVRERPRAGVYDAPLLPRMQKLVAILPAYEPAARRLRRDRARAARVPRGRLARAVRRRPVDRELPVLSRSRRRWSRPSYLEHADELEDEVREVLQASSSSEIGAVSARIVEHDDVRTGVPARTLALGGGEYLRVELPTHVERPRPRARHRGRVRARSRGSCARSVGAGRSRGCPRSRSSPGALPSTATRCIERIEAYMQGLAGIDRATNAFVTRGKQLIASARAARRARGLALAVPRAPRARAPTRPAARTARSSTPTPTR